MIESSNDLFFARLPERISFVEDLVMLWAFSGSFSATIDMLRDNRRPSLRVRSDIDPPRPRLARVSAGPGGVSSVPPAPAVQASSLEPAIALSLSTSTLTPSPPHHHQHQTLSPESLLSLSDHNSQDKMHYSKINIVTRRIRVNCDSYGPKPVYRPFKNNRLLRNRWVWIGTIVVIVVFKWSALSRVCEELGARRVLGSSRSERLVSLLYSAFTAPVGATNWPPQMPQHVAKFTKFSSAKRLYVVILLYTVNMKPCF